ncbi:hypothetical protein HYALB_00000042 [Hymenoscyphus albidus]|uniref:AAA+ ATPase domain-containing protein n=1 Tax=Hymenoscyphus albidus TaxID=595503 RepID=A0A9N9LDF5_9HELO|nr:hypothetical protein HYALB_00000042 [Hymenoscyphus albidus]
MNHVEWEYRMKSGRDSEKWVLTIDSFTSSTGRKETGIDIISPYLKKVICGVVKFDPSLDRFSDRLSMRHPFQPFFHHWNDIEKAIGNDIGVQEDEKEAFEILKWVYEKYLPVKDPQSTLKSQHESIRQYLESSEINYENLWAVYEPGTRVLVRDKLGEWQMLMVVSCELDLENESNHWSRQQRARPKWKVRMWQMTWNSAKECFTRILWPRAIQPFLGTRQISNLQVLPLEYYEDKTGKLSKMQAQSQLQQALEKRGNKWATFIKQNDPTCLYYEGPAAKLPDPEPSSWNSEPPPATVVNLKGRVVMDQDRDFNIGDLHEFPRIPSPYGPVQDMVAFENDVLASDNRPEYAASDDNPRSKQFPWESFQAQLCPTAILSFHMESNGWHLVPVEHLQKVPWRSDMLENLVMLEEKKSLLVDLLESYKTKENAGIQDIVKGKGEGLVVLLRGPPGVGKTLTAEVVAENLHRPLQSISLSTLLDQRGDFETSLIETFQQASRQKVILLLDEVDVILEERAYEDVRRNSIVSNPVFLRRIEYFDGIVFLTTNRPGTIDEAFESRVHLSIEYPKLNSALRTKLWLQFLKNLEPQVDFNIADVIDNLDKLKLHGLNGRQIRNVINVSAAIARARTGGVLDVEVVKRLAWEASGLFERLSGNSNKSKSITSRGERGLYNNDAIIHAQLLAFESATLIVCLNNNRHYQKVALMPAHNESSIRDDFGWVQSPDGRGTLDIIWTCLLVIFTAVYTAIHLNVPAPTDTFFKIAIRKFRWILGAILAPDVVTGVAGSQWHSARTSVFAMRSLGYNSWTMEHAFYADSGGFLLHAPDMRPFPINAASVHFLVKSNYLPLPSITRDEIWDRSKSDKFAKGAALIQTGWLVISSIARLAEGLPLCQLEIFTLAFAVSTVMTYYFWLHKAQNLTTSTVLVMESTLAKVLTDAGTRADSPWRDTPMDFVEKPLTNWKRRDTLEKFDLNERPLQRIPDDAQLPHQSWELAMTLLVAMPSMLHSALHLAGWNVEFPTTEESLLWKASAITLTAIGCISFAVVGVLRRRGYCYDARFNSVQWAGNAGPWMWKPLDYVRVRIGPNFISPVTQSRPESRDSRTNPT